MRSFASADAWLEADAERSPGILLFHWRQPGRTDGAALLDRVAGRGDLALFVAADRLSMAERARSCAAGRTTCCPHRSIRGSSGARSMARWTICGRGKTRWRIAAAPPRDWRR